MRSGLEPRSAQPNNSQQCIRTGRCISTTVAVVAVRPTTLTFEQACLMAGFGKSADADDSWKSSVIVLSTRQPSTYTRTWNPSAQLSCGSVSSSAQPAEQQYCTVRYLYVPPHGSPKMLFVAATLQLTSFWHCAWTMPVDISSWQPWSDVAACGHTSGP